jgi:hypothetical protein
MNYPAGAVFAGNDGILMIRPPERFGLERFHAAVAITSPFNRLPSAVELTAPLDGVPPTWRIKSMSLRRVGPEQGSELRFLAPVVTTDSVHGDVTGAADGWVVVTRPLVSSERGKRLIPARQTESLGGRLRFFR